MEIPKIDTSNHKNYVAFGRKYPNGYCFPLGVFRCLDKDFDLAQKEAEMRFQGSKEDIGKYPEVFLATVSKVSVTDLKWAIDKLDVTIHVKDEKPAEKTTEKPAETPTGP